MIRALLLVRLPHRAAKGSTSPGAYTPVTLTCHLCPLLPPDASLSRLPAHSASRPSSQRLTAGIIHGIRLGSATVLRTFNGRPYIGTVSSFRHPWFKISYTDGDAEDLDGDQLAAHIIYSNDDNTACCWPLTRSYGVWILWMLGSFTHVVRVHVEPHALRVSVDCLTEYLNTISLYCYSHY